MCHVNHHDKRNQEENAVEHTVHCGIEVIQLKKHFLADVWVLLWNRSLHLSEIKDKHKGPIQSDHKNSDLCDIKLLWEVEKLRKSHEKKAYRRYKKACYHDGSSAEKGLNHP